MSKLSVQLVVWNGSKYIPHLFESLRKQSCQDWSLIILDNGSKDNTVEVIKKELENFVIHYKFIESKDKNGIAGGHAQAFKENDSEYVLLLNQDMYLTPDCLGKMVEFLDKHPEAGAVTPRLMRWDFASINCHPRESGDPVTGKHLDSRLRGNDTAVPGATNVIDALGLRIFRNRRVVEDKTGQEWSKVSCHCEERSDETISGLQGDCHAPKGARNDNVEVFGVSGAFPMYRRSALIDIFLPNGDFLDSSYFMYKEDVDLAYRLASRGWKSFVLLNSVAYHDRAGAGPKELTDTAALKNKKSHSSWVKHYSYKNHLMTLYKNEYGQNFTLDFPWILWYELKKVVYFLLFDRSVLAGLSEVWKLRHDLKQKREHITKLRKVDFKEIRKWWSKL